MPLDGGEGLEGKLAGYPGPAYRKAYLENLLRSGNRFHESGNERGARYCFAKVAEALQTAAPAPVPEAEDPETKAKPLPATERVRRQWRQERLKDAENVLGKHAGRLSALEFQSYRERLEKLRSSGQAASTASQSEKADAGILELRRRLYQRVLKSQKISLTTRRVPMTLARLASAPQAGPKAASFPVPSAPGRKAGPASKVRVDTEWRPAVGPYNDRYNMEDLLSLITDADPAWVQEFLDLYRGLSGMQDLVSAIALAKK